MLRRRRNCLPRLFSALGMRICHARVVRASCSNVAMPVMTGCGTLLLRSPRVAEPLRIPVDQQSVVATRSEVAARLIASVSCQSPLGLGRRYVAWPFRRVFRMWLRVKPRKTSDAQGAQPNHWTTVTLNQRYRPTFLRSLHVEVLKGLSQWNVSYCSG